MKPTPLPEYQVAAPALLRAPLRSLEEKPVTGTSHGELTDRLAKLTADALLMEAVELASPPLAHQVQRPPELLKAKEIRSAVLALNAYAARLRGRATPYGLFAGVTLASTEGPPQARLGPVNSHRKYIRPDAGWVVRELAKSAAQPAVLHQLRMWSNPATRLRRERLWLISPGDLAASATESGPREVSIRPTTAVRAILKAARDGASGAAVIQAAQHAGLHEQEGEKLVVALLKTGFLLSRLHTFDTASPLGQIADQLGTASLPATAMLPYRRLAQQLEHYRAIPAGDGQRSLRALSNAATPSTSATNTPTPSLHVDTVLKAEVCLGKEVAREAEAAAQLLGRLSNPSPGEGLRQYLATRFGLGRSVPLLSLEDTLEELPAAGLQTDRPERAAALIDAYVTAQRNRSEEIELTDDLLDLLEPHHHGAHPTDFDLYALVASRSMDALRCGDFKLILRSMPAASGAGNALARFTYALGPKGHQALRTIRTVADQVVLDDSHPNAAVADLTFRPLQSHAYNVARVPLLRDLRIAVNLAPGDGTQNLDLRKLNLHATTDRVVVWSEELDQEVLPRLVSSLSPGFTAPPLARVLALAAASKGRSPGPFDWGPLASTTWRPRLRRGRTVVAPQSWIPGRSVSAGGENFTLWRKEWNVPRHVSMADGDRGIPLDLDDPLDRKWLHNHMDENTLLYETSQHSFGWLSSEQGAHLTECVFPMARTTPHPRPAEMAREPAPAPMQFVGQYLSLLITCPEEATGPFLSKISNGCLDTPWFFTRTGHLNRLQLVYSTPSDQQWHRLLGGVSEAVTDLRPDFPSISLSVQEYAQDAGIGIAVLRQKEAEAWAQADTKAVLAIAADKLIPAQDLHLLDTVDLAWGLDDFLRSSETDTHADSLLARLASPDRNSFAPRRRRLMPHLISAPRWDSLSAAATVELPPLWRRRTRAACEYVQRLPRKVRRPIAASLVRTHAIRAVGPEQAPQMLAIAAAAEHAHASWLRATARGRAHVA